MHCPYCRHDDSKVIDKRETTDNDSTRRRRECLECEKRFTTYERIEDVNLVVIKKNGSREKFDREKLIRSFAKACEKRPISKNAIEEQVDKIESKMRNQEQTEISSVAIGEEVMKSLKKMDKVAYIRFASVYRDFTDLTDFENELQKLSRH